SKAKRPHLEPPWWAPILLSGQGHSIGFCSFANPVVRGEMQRLEGAYLGVSPRLVEGAELLEARRGGLEGLVAFGEAEPGEGRGLRGVGVEDGGRDGGHADH